jgi:glucan biosynthesis protein
MIRAFLFACSLAVLTLRHGAIGQEFTFESVRAPAKERAGVPYVPPPDELADFWKNLTYDQHRNIRFKKWQSGQRTLALSVEKAKKLK